MFFYLTSLLDSHKIFILIPLVIISMFILSPSEAFAATPEPEAYIERTLPNYGRTDPIEPDWYTQDRTNVNVNQCDDQLFNGNEHKIHKFSGYYISLKNRTSWYMWKCHTKKYGSYADFKKSSRFNTSISQDIKKLFSINKK